MHPVHTGAGNESDTYNPDYPSCPVLSVPEDTCLSFLNHNPITDMERGTILPVLKHLSLAVTRGLILAVVLPFIPALIFNISPASILALITGTFVIEYGAAALGIGLGLPPLYVLFVLSCVALGVILTLFEIFDVLGMHSEKVSRFLKKSEERAGRSRILKKYGIYGLVACVITLGFYVCPPVSWVLGWPRNRSILLIMAGYISISIVTILVTMGFFAIIGV
jgi:hypothetical protein